MTSAMVRAISLHQPWADWVVLQEKEYETRSWSTPYRGPLLVHATQRKCDGCSACDEFPFEGHAYGAIVGVAKLIDVATTDEVKKRTCISTAELSRGDWGPDRFAWRLTDAQCCILPVRCRGRQRLWTPSVEVVRKVYFELTDQDPSGDLSRYVHRETYIQSVLRQCLEGEMPQ